MMDKDIGKWLDVLEGKHRRLISQSPPTRIEYYAVSKSVLAALRTRLAELETALREFLRCHAGGGYVKPHDDVLQAARDAAGKDGE